MTEPTLQDVLTAITTLDAKIDAKTDSLAADLKAHRAETAAHRAETARSFAEIAKNFADLDLELATHNARVHREIDRRLDALETRAKKPARSTVRTPRRR